MISATARITKDTITPDLKSRIKALANPHSVLQAMGMALTSIATLAFRQANLRPTPWKEVKKITGAPLYGTGDMKHSILRSIRVNGDSVTVGSPKKYAAYHQFGTKPYVITPKNAKSLFWPGARHHVKKVNHPGLPPRPFFPFFKNGHITPEAKRRLGSTAKAAIDSQTK